MRKAHQVEVALLRIGEETHHHDQLMAIACELVDLWSCDPDAAHRLGVPGLELLEGGDDLLHHSSRLNRDVPAHPPAGLPVSRLLESYEDARGVLTRRLDELNGRDSTRESTGEVSLAELSARVEGHPSHIALELSQR